MPWLANWPSVRGGQLANIRRPLPIGRIGGEVLHDGDRRVEVGRHDCLSDCLFGSRVEELRPGAPAVLSAQPSENPAMNAVLVSFTSFIVVVPVTDHFTQARFPVEAGVLLLKLLGLG